MEKKKLSDFLTICSWAWRLLPLLVLYNYKADVLIFLRSVISWLPVGARDEYRLRAALICAPGTAVTELAELQGCLGSLPTHPSF